MKNNMPKTEEGWKEQLTPEQYVILREKGTEAPFSGTLLHEKREGMYTCAACGNRLFASDAKFESTEPGLRGWPSFDEAIPGSVEYVKDTSGGMHRTEVVCAKCKSHLGHVFNAPDAPSGKHYCVNSVCLALEPKGETR